MPHGVRITSLPAREPYEIGLKLGRPVVRLLDREAALHEMKRLELVRALLLRHVGLDTMTRSRHAPARRPVGARAHDKQRMPITLGPGPLSILLEMSNCLGNASKSTIVSHLILDWAGVSPLGGGAVAGAGRRRAATGRNVPPDKTLVLSLAEPVLAIVDAEARALATSRSELLRALIRARLGSRAAKRPAPRGKHKPLANREHAKQRVSVTLARGDVQLLDEVAARLGGGERATIVSHVILEWVGISPLRRGFPFRSARRRRP